MKDVALKGASLEERCRMSEVVTREAGDDGSARSPGGADFLWTGLGLVEPLEARVSGGLPAAPGGRRRATGVSIDTRTLQPGDLFFAINGVSSDGHDYVAAAFGARAPSPPSSMRPTPTD